MIDNFPWVRLLVLLSIGGIAALSIFGALAVQNGILIAIRQDVTDFKEQEMLLRNQVAETELFRAILEDLPAPVFVRNAKHELTYANHAYEKMLGDHRDRQ